MPRCQDNLIHGTLGTPIVQEGFNMPEIFSHRSARICGVNIKTFDKWVDNGLVPILRTIPRVINGKDRPMRVFDEAKIRQFKKKIDKKRSPGMPIIFLKPKRSKRS
jgi:hypothetical protein